MADYSGVPIEHLGEVSSTNDVARECAASVPHGWAVRADVQTAGRGQRGHGWTSPAGGLYLSVVLKPEVPQHLMTGVPLVCGIGAARALEGLGITDVKIKWPNDLVAGAAKLGGMLTEAGWSPEGVYAVCGIGVNMTSPRVKDPSPRALPATGLETLLAGDAPARDLGVLADALRAGIAGTVEEWAADVKRAGTAATPLGRLGSELYDRMAFMGSYVGLIDRSGNAYAAGTLTGIDLWGRALVRLDDGTGEERTFDPAQVSIRPL